MAANNTSGANLGFENELWRAADALQDFDFEDAFDAGRVTVHEAAVQPRKTTKLTDERIGEVAAAEQYRQAEALERSRPKSSGEFDFFETPYPLSVFMTRVSEVKKGDKVLEPSAGQGSLLRFLPDGVDVDALEVNRQHAHKLSQMGLKVVSTQIDFLIWTPYRGEYDVILMNPPFSRKAGVGWQDAVHVMKAYEHLKDGGRLVAVMGEGSFFRSDKQSSAFRDWLDEVGAQVVKMPEEVFKRSGTKVNVRLVVIDKGAEPGRTDMDLPEATTDRYLELEGYITPRAEQATAEPTPERQEAVEQAQEEAETATEEALSPEAEQQPSRTVERKAIEPTAKGAETQVEVPGFCKSATLDDIRHHNHILTPGRYVGAAEMEDDGEPFETKMQRLAVELHECFAEGDQLEARIKKNLEGLGYGE